MNYLAHIFLSGNDRCIQIGNFIGGKDKNSKYPGNPGKGAFLCFKSHILKRLKNF